MLHRAVNSLKCLNKRYVHSEKSSVQNVLLFPGQGSQSVGMGQDLVIEFPYIKQLYQEVNEHLKFSLDKLMFEVNTAELL
jgi:malonyl CoA-acyl carrier protein transacylase